MVLAIIDIRNQPPSAANIRPRKGPVAQLVRAGDSSEMVRLSRNAQDERDEFRELAAGHAGNNPEPSCGYTRRRCRDYLGAGVPLITG